MARVTVRTAFHPLVGPVATMFPNGAKLLDGWGRRAVLDVQQRLWADSRFKNATGRSRKGWKVEADLKGLGLALVNDATNRYGTFYAKYVHLAGRPKADKLVFEVQSYMTATIGPQLAAALGRDYVANVGKRKATITAKTYGA